MWADVGVGGVEGVGVGIGLWRGFIVVVFVFVVLFYKDYEVIYGKIYNRVGNVYGGFKVGLWGYKRYGRGRNGCWWRWV